MAIDQEQTPGHFNTRRRRHNRLPPPRRTRTGRGVPRRLHVRHDRHQGAHARCLLRGARPGLSALRLFRPRRLVGRFRRSDGRALDARMRSRRSTRSPTGPQVLVGSSMGGWLMLLAALARPERIRALVGIAAAPDATEALMWRRLPPALRDGDPRRGHDARPVGLCARGLSHHPPADRGRAQPSGHGSGAGAGVPGAPAARHGRHGRAVADQPRSCRARLPAPTSN